MNLDIAFLFCDGNFTPL